MSTQPQLEKITIAVLTELNRCYPNLVTYNRALQTHILSNTQFAPELIMVLEEQVKDHNQFSTNTGLIPQIDELFSEIDEEYSQQCQVKVDQRKASWDNFDDGLDDDDDMSFLDEMDGEDADMARGIFSMLDEIDEQTKNAKPVSIAYAQSHKYSLNNVLTLLDMMYPLETLMTTTLITDDYMKLIAYRDPHPIRYGLRVANKEREDIIEQAEEIYNKILAMPDTYKVVDEFGFIEKGKQSVQGQFWLLALANILKDAFIQDEQLVDWFLHKIENAPDKLFMFSHELTSQPATWWAELVQKSPYHQLDALLRDKHDSCLQASIDSVQNEQEITQQLSSISNDGEIAIVPLTEVGFSEAQDELISTLNQFTEVLKQNFKDLEIRTTTDINISAIEKQLAPLQFAEDIRVFYHWSLQFDDVERFFEFPRIENLASTYHFYLETLQQDDAMHWSKALFNFAYESQVYLITPLSETPPATQMIYFYDMVDGDFEGYFDSVLAMVKSYVKAYEAELFDTEDGYGSAYFSEEDENEEECEERWNELRLEINPNAYNQNNEDSRTKGNYIEYWEVETWPNEWRKYQIGEVEEN